MTNKIHDLENLKALSRKEKVEVKLQTIRNKLQTLTEEELKKVFGGWKPKPKKSGGVWSDNY